jgi:rod shape-determining protein MreC
MPSALKSIVQWVVYAGLVLLAGGMMLLGKADAVLVEKLRLQINDTVVPILDILSEPADVAADSLDRLGQWADVADDNARLRVERDRLLHWQTVAQRLESENAALRDLLNYVPEPEATWRAARVIADATGAFAHSLLVNAGSLAGIDKGQVVLSGEGLVGRVVGTSQRASRVLLITDLNSRIPVFVGTARIRAVLAGDNTDRPKLLHVVPGSTIVSGDPVVTSGIAGGFPPGLPVGTVLSVDDGRIAVDTRIDRSRLEYVRIVDYGMAALRVDPPAAGRADGTGSRSAGDKPTVRADAR